MIQESNDCAQGAESSTALKRPSSAMQEQCPALLAAPDSQNGARDLIVFLHSCWICLTVKTPENETS